MNKALVRRRNALFCVPFSFVCGGGGQRAARPGSPIDGAEVDHPVGWAGKSGSREVLSRLILHLRGMKLHLRYIRLQLWYS